MANEAVLIYETEVTIQMTVADGTGIEKGALLKLTDPFTASAASTDHDLVAGIAGAEKIASNGQTKLKVFRAGIFKVLLSGSATVGDPMTIEGDTTNSFKTAVNLTRAQLSGSRTWGIALETGTNGETILMELRPMADGGA